METHATNALMGAPKHISSTLPVKYCLYARKSTESDEKQALSIDSQVNEMLAIAKRDNLNVVDIRRESYSSKETGKRPVFNQMLDDVRIGKFNALLTWATRQTIKKCWGFGCNCRSTRQKYPSRSTNLRTAL